MALDSVFRQTTYVGPVFNPPPPSKLHHHHHQQQQQQQPGREKHGGHGDGDSAPLERRPARRTNPATVNNGPAPGNDAEEARPSSYPGDFPVTSRARPRILLIRSNTDRTSHQV